MGTSASRLRRLCGALRTTRIPTAAVTREWENVLSCCSTAPVQDGVAVDDQDELPLVRLEPIEHVDLSGAPAAFLQAMPADSGVGERLHRPVHRAVVDHVHLVDDDGPLVEDRPDAGVQILERLLVSHHDRHCPAGSDRSRLGAPGATHAREFS